jgi:hypothetical protein
MIQIGRIEVDFVDPSAESQEYAYLAAIFQACVYLRIWTEYLPNEFSGLASVHLGGKAVTGNQLCH